MDLKTNCPTSSLIRFAGIYSIPCVLCINRFPRAISNLKVWAQALWALLYIFLSA